MSLQNPATYPTIEPVSRDQVRALCLDLGHDPNKVSTITIEHGTVSVVYIHRIVEPPKWDGKPVPDTQPSPPY